MEGTQGVTSHYPEKLATGIILLTTIGITLPMAWISLAKLTLALYAIGTFVQWHHCQSRWQSAMQVKGNRIILIGLAWLAVSILWTEAPIEHAMKTWGKHAKLLAIPILMVLLHSRTASRLAMRSFLMAMSGVVLLSWLMVFGVKVPFTTSQDAFGPVVFSESYIDQAVMFCIGSALAWHCRNDQLLPRWLGYGMPLAAILNVLLVLPGRTGYLIALALICIVIAIEVPRRIRWAALVLAPTFAIVTLLMASSQFSTRVERALTESRNFNEQNDTSSSAGWRLNAWHRSLQAIAARPLSGHGVGSFVPAVKEFESGNKDLTFGSGFSSNPHQEFLLWGVEAGVGASLALLCILLAFAHRARQFSPSAHRATLSVIVTIGIACMFNSALYDDLLGDFLCVALGMCLAYGRHSTSPETLTTGT